MVFTCRVFGSRLSTRRYTRLYIHGGQCIRLNQEKSLAAALLCVSVHLRNGRRGFGGHF